MHSNLTFDRQKSLREPESEASPRPVRGPPVAGRQKNWPIPAARIGRKKPFANRIRELKLVRRARQRAGRSRNFFLLFYQFLAFLIAKVLKFWKFDFSKNSNFDHFFKNSRKMPISRNKHSTSILTCCTPTNVIKWCWMMYSNLTFDR